MAFSISISPEQQAIMDKGKGIKPSLNIGKTQPITPAKVAPKSTQASSKPITKSTGSVAGIIQPSSTSNRAIDKYGQHINPTTGKVLFDSPVHVTSGLDETVVNLAKAIRQRESGNRAVLPGEGSKLGGASRYQYTHGTWASTAGKYLGDSKAPLTAENENKATYLKIKEWKDKGMKPAQIAAMWNAGEGEPDAYTGKFSNGKASEGTNKFGVHYSVPNHTKAVLNYYQNFKTHSEKEKSRVGSYAGTETAPDTGIGAHLAAAVDNPMEAGKGLVKGVIGMAGGAMDLVNKYSPIKGPAWAQTANQNISQYLGEKSQASNMAQETGKTVAEIAPYLAGGEIPGAIAGASRAVLGGSKLAGVAGRMLGEAGLAGGVTAVQEGEVNKNVLTNAAMGAAFPMAGGLLKGAAPVTKALGNKMAEGTINSLIKPLLKDFSYGKNPGRGVAQEGLVANSLEELAPKITGRLKEIGSEMDNVLTHPDNLSNYTTEASKAFQPLYDAMSNLKKNPSINSATIKRLGDTINDIMQVGADGRPRIDTAYMNVLDVNNLKKEIADLARYTGVGNSDDAIINKAIQQTVGKLKTIVNEMEPRMKGLNERWANLKSAEIATKYRDMIESRQNVLSLSQKGITGLLGAGGVFTGNPVMIAAALVNLGADKLLSSSAFKTRFAKWMASAPAAEKASVFQKVPWLKSVSERIFGKTEVAPKVEGKIKPQYKALPPGKTVTPTYSAGTMTKGQVQQNALASTLGTKSKPSLYKKEGLMLPVGKTKTPQIPIELPKRTQSTIDKQIAKKPEFTTITPEKIQYTSNLKSKIAEKVQASDEELMKEFNDKVAKIVEKQQKSFQKERHLELKEQGKGILNQLKEEKVLQKSLEKEKEAMEKSLKEVKTFSGTLEDAYKDFKKLVQYHKPEILFDGDIESFTKGMTKEQRDKISNTLWSQDATDNEIFDKFRERLYKERYQK